jgi:hypothetical protein
MTSATMVRWGWGGGIHTPQGRTLPTAQTEVARAAARRCLRLQCMPHCQPLGLLATEGGWPACVGRVGDSLSEVVLGPHPADRPAALPGSSTASPLSSSVARCPSGSSELPARSAGSEFVTWALHPAQSSDPGCQAIWAPAERSRGARQALRAMGRATLGRRGSVVGAPGSMDFVAVGVALLIRLIRTFFCYLSCLSLWNILYSLNCCTARAPAPAFCADTARQS